MHLLKIHGSCNFIVDEKRIKVMEKVTINRKGRFESTIIRPPPHPDAIPSILRQCKFPPAMALYTPEKEVLSCSTEIKKLQQEYDRVAREAEAVVVVGADLHTSDEHVWGPLIGTNATVGFLGNSSGFKAFARHREGKRTVWLGERFESSLEELFHFIDSMR